MDGKQEILGDNYYRKRKIAYNVLIYLLFVFIIALFITGFYVDNFMLFIVAMVFMFMTIIITLLFASRKENLEEHYKIYRSIKEKSDQETQ